MYVRINRMLMMVLLVVMLLMVVLMVGVLVVVVLSSSSFWVRVRGRRRMRGRVRVRVSSSTRASIWCCIDMRGDRRDSSCSRRISTSGCSNSSTSYLRFGTSTANFGGFFIPTPTTRLFWACSDSGYWINFCAIF